MKKKPTKIYSNPFAQSQTSVVTKVAIVCKPNGIVTNIQSDEEKF